MKINKYDDLMQRIGFEFVHTKWRVTPTRSDISAFETELGYQLPSGYSNFVSKYGCAGSKNGSWVIRDENGVDEGGVGVFYGFAPTSGYDLRTSRVEFSHDDLPFHVLPIATSSGGSLIVISLAGNACGSVYSWHPEDPFGGETTEFIAKDFDSFLHKLSCE